MSSSGTKAPSHYDPARWAIVPSFVTTLNGFLLVAPMLSGWALALLVRRPGAILISTLLFAALIIGYVFDLIPANSAGNMFLIMTMMGIAILPAANTTRASILITVVAGAQIVIAWAAAFNRPIVARLDAPRQRLARWPERCDPLRLGQLTWRRRSPSRSPTSSLLLASR